MVFFSGLFSGPRQRRIERAGFALYAQAVTQARMPLYFEEFLVPDTLDGRFDLVGLFAALVIRRLRRDRAPGLDLAQAVFDAMFSDMDVNLREMGLGDMSVARRVKKMWEGFHGRAAVYEQCLDAHDETGLAEALRRNVWRGTQEGDATRLARRAIAVGRHLDELGLAALAQGELSFPAPEGT